MWNKNLQAIVLAAGQAKRFKTGRTKLLEPLCGREMILYSTKLLEGLDIKTTLVVGHQKNELIETVKKHHKNVTFVEQNKQLGTGHAVCCTKDLWEKETVLILNGDMPLITPQIIEQLYSAHHTNKATISFVTAHLEYTHHFYGRVVEKNGITEIVEAKDFKDDPRNYQWINAGIYLIDTKFLQKNSHLIDNSNASEEFYLTDLVGMASKQGHTVVTVPASYERVRGVNTLEELWRAEQVKRSDLIKYWMSQGVRFVKAQNVHLHMDVSIGAGTCIGGGVYLEGNTVIGKNCTIREYTRLENATLGDNVFVRSHSVITDSTIRDNAEVGPFAHVRSESIIDHHASIGNFVEVKKSFVGQESKARHLAYIGDATLGKNVNIGAGTITCNFDGIQKHETSIGDNAQVGSNNTLVAPLTIEKNSYTAAGSTITETVPENALAFGRARQMNKEGYAPKLLGKLKDKNNSPKVQVKKKKHPSSPTCSSKSKARSRRLLRTRKKEKNA